MSIRIRVTLVFTLALAIAFALGSWLLVSQLRNQLLGATDKALRPQLSVARQYLAVQPPEEFPFLVQLIDPAGHVVRASREATSPVLTPAELHQAATGQIHGFVTQDEVRYRFIAGPVRGQPPGWVAVVGQSVGDLNAAVTAQAGRLALGGVVLVLLGAVGAYWLATAALSPVERMRREVAALSERDAHGGVQVPGTRDELAALAGTMNELLARLHGALARQRGFVADASHELRSPLAVLGAELELAGRPGRSRDELATAVANADDEVARLTRITNDLLVLARSDEGRLPVRPVPADVGDLLESSVAAAAGRARAAGVDCATDVPADLVAMIDQDRIRQAVDNMIDNALRFAPAGSAVTVRGERAGTDLVIEVADAGPGFPADYLPHAFERFRRPDAGRARSEGGAGLGLAIVAAIAAAHGGTASASNSPDGGAVVTMRLPGVVDPE
jgi:two-component system, OmpR family, sensor kinase